MTDRRRLFSTLMLSTVTVMAAWPLSATTYVVISDSALLASSPLVVEGRVVASETGSGPFIEYRVEVDRWLKGAAIDSPIRVRLPGGTDSANRTLRIEGVPRLQLAQRVLLFLSPLDDGAHVPTHLGLGTFFRIDGADGPIAVRGLGEALVLAPMGGLASEPLRNFQRFVTWIESQPAPGAEADYWIDRPATPPRSLAQPFTLFESGGLNMRWAEFDTGDSVTFFAHQDGQPDLPGGGFAELQTGLAAWTDHESTPIQYLYGGTTSGEGGLVEFDAINAIQFDDPNANQDFGGPFDCESGGVLALGGPWFMSGTTHQHNGSTFLTILGGDVVTNRGAGCFFALNGGSNAEEVFAHELGHTLGLRHSCGDGPSGVCDTTAKQEALMVAFAHGDGRGAQLGEDDSQGIELLYRQGGISCTPDANTLCLDDVPGDARFRVTLAFDSVLAGGISGQAATTPLALVGIRKGGIFAFTDPNNPELLVKVLNGCGFNQHYWVFYAATTTVGFELTVEDTANDLVRTYSNPDLMTAAPVTDLEAFATCP